MARVLYVSVQGNWCRIKEAIPMQSPLDNKVVESYDLSKIANAQEIAYVIKRVRMAYEFPDEFSELTRLENIAKGESIYG